MFQSIPSLLCAGAPFAPVANFLVQQNFEGSGKPADWTTIVGAPNYDYAVAPLQGLQSLYLPLTSGNVRSAVDFDNQIEVWTYFLMLVTTTVTVSSVTLGASSANGVNTMSNLFQIGTSMRLSYGGSPITPILPSTIYHVWLHFKQGTGANAVIDIGYSTDGIRPTSGGTFDRQTNAPATNLVGRMQFGTNVSNETTDVIFDDVRISDVQIGDNGII